MGNKPSTRASKSERAKRNAVKENVIQDRLTAINNMQHNIGNNRQLVIAEQAQIFQIAETAKTQLNRGSAPFTKSDLVAIAVALTKNADRDAFDMLTELTVGDLNAYIRSIVYDPEVHMQHMITQGGASESEYIINTSSASSEAKRVSDKRVSVIKKR